MRFCLLVLLLSAFALTLVCAETTALGNVDSASDSKKMEVKKALSRLRRIHRVESEERIVPPVAAYYYYKVLPTTSTQSSQILHTVEDNKPLSKGAKAVVAVIAVGMIMGAIIGAVKFTKMINSTPMDSEAA